MAEAIITGIVAIAVCMINNAFQSRKSHRQHEQTIAMIDYKLEQLTARVDKHNNVIERTFELEKRTAILSEKVEVANNRIKNLVESGK